MKKIALLLVLSLFIFELPAFSSEKINSVESCKPPEKQLNSQPIQKNNFNRIKNLPKTKTIDKKKEVLSDASCQFGVCGPKPPKR